jgi:hypothetical protein
MQDGRPSKYINFCVTACDRRCLGFHTVQKGSSRRFEETYRPNVECDYIRFYDST